MWMSATASASGGAPQQPLHEAAQRGDVAQLRTALEQGAQVDPRNRRGETPLLVATHHNQVEAARLLMAAGADVNAKDQIQDSPYLYAGARGHNEILKMTLQHGADLQSLNRYGGTALIPAAERGHVETVRLLIAAGVDVNHINRLHWTALMEAIVLGQGGPQHVQIVQDLLAAGADPHIADAEGITPCSMPASVAMGRSRLCCCRRGEALKRQRVGPTQGRA